MSATTLSIHLADDGATAALAQRLAPALRPGDLVLLEGGLGAGKTALARGIIRALVGDPELDVPSPSFALVQPYEAGSTTILHADLYRLTAAGEIEELGLLDDPRGIVLVEWPERVPELGEQASVRIAIEVPVGGVGRRVTIVAPDGRAI